MLYSTSRFGNRTNNMLLEKDKLQEPQGVMAHYHLQKPSSLHLISQKALGIQVYSSHTIKSSQIWLLQLRNVMQNQRVGSCAVWSCLLMQAQLEISVDSSRGSTAHVGNTQEECDAKSSFSQTSDGKQKIVMCYWQSKSLGHLADFY